MKRGDVIFQNLPKLSYVNLIDGVQGGGPHHCAIVSGKKWGIWWAIEAFPFLGVWELPVFLFWLRWPFGLAARTWKDLHQDTIDLIIAIAGTQKGKPYNIHFSDNTASYYCSDLIGLAYQTATNQEIDGWVTAASLEDKFPALVAKYFNPLPDRKG